MSSRSPTAKDQSWFEYIQRADRRSHVPTAEVYIPEMNIQYWGSDVRDDPETWIRAVTECCATNLKASDTLQRLEFATKSGSVLTINVHAHGWQVRLQNCSSNYMPCTTKTSLSTHTITKYWYKYPWSYMSRCYKSAIPILQRQYHIGSATEAEALNCRDCSTELSVREARHDWQAEANCSWSPRSGRKDHEHGELRIRACYSILLPVEGVRGREGHWFSQGVAGYWRIALLDPGCYAFQKSCLWACW